MSVTDNKKSSLPPCPTAPCWLRMVFKRPQPNKKLSDAETQLLRSYIGEILEEITVEEKRILEEERLAALEITTRKQEK